MNDSVDSVDSSFVDRCRAGAGHGMNQPRFHSALESLANVAVGYLVALASQLTVFPLFDIYVPFSSNLAIGAWFTAISLVRSYVLRRWFNGLRFKAPAPALPAKDQQ